MSSAGSFYFYEVITIDAALTLSILRSVGAFFVCKGVEKRDESDARKKLKKVSPILHI